MSAVGTREWLDEAVPRLSDGALSVFAAVYKPHQVIVSVTGLPPAGAGTYALAMLEGELCGELNEAGALQARDGVEDFVCVRAPSL